MRSSVGSSEVSMNDENVYPENPILFVTFAFCVPCVERFLS